MNTRWAVYKQVSPRTAVLVGHFYSSLDYAGELEHRACKAYRKTWKRRHAQKYKVFLATVKAPAIREGW